MTGGWLAQHAGQGFLHLGDFVADKDAIALGWGLGELKTSVHCRLLVVISGLQQEPAWGQASILGMGLRQGSVAALQVLTGWGCFTDHFSGLQEEPEPQHLPEAV